MHFPQLAELRGWGLGWEVLLPPQPPPHLVWLSRGAGIIATQQVSCPPGTTEGVLVLVVTG